MENKDINLNEKKIKDIVERHRNDVRLTGVQSSLDPEQDMYYYGSDAEFELMAADLKREFSIYMVPNFGSKTLKQFVEYALLWLEVSMYVQETIQHHRTDDIMVVGRSPIRLDEIMYSYGSSEEFEAIINDIEAEYDVELNDEEIGEDRVHEFINHVYCKVKKKTK